jgi:hypothetical protein
VRGKLLTIATALAICAPGCGKRGSKGATDDAAAPPPQKIAGPRSVLLDKKFRDEALGTNIELPKLDSAKLLEPGKGKRTAYRYAMTGESKRVFTVATTVKTRELAGGAWTERIEVPEVSFGLELTHPAKSADKGLRVFARALEPTIADGSPTGKTAATQLIARYRALVEGRRATIENGGRGLPGKVTVTGLTPDDDGARPAQELNTMLAQSVVPFPEEPIGVGAKWKVVIMLRRGEAVVKQTAVYELKKVEGTQLTIDQHIKQVGENQYLFSPDLPKGVTSELIAFFWETRGTVTVDPSVLTPVAGSITVELRVHGKLVHPAETYEHFNESIGTATLSTK